MEPNQEQQIIEKSRNGDRESFRLLVEHYQQLIFSAAVKMVCQEDVAKDIVQETFIRIWTNLDKYDNSKNFKTWIYTIATRLSLDYIRKESHTDYHDEDSYLTNYIDDSSPGERLENKELASIIHQLVRDLSPKQRVTFTLKYLEGLETDEIATITGMNANKIKGNLYQARKTVKERLKQLGYE